MPKSTPVKKWISIHELINDENDGWFSDFCTKVEKLLGQDIEPPERKRVQKYFYKGYSPERAAIEYLDKEHRSRWGAGLFLRFILRAVCIGVIIL